MKAFKWIAFAVSAGVRGGRCRFKSHQVWLLRLLFKFDVFGRDESGIGQRQPAPAPQSKDPRKGGQLVVDDVVVLGFLLQLFDIINLNHQAQAFAGEQEEGIDQGLGCLAANIGFLPFVVLFHVLVGQALDLLVCELNANGLFGFARRNKDGQLLAFGGDVVGIRRKPEIHYPCGRGGVRRGLQKLNDFVQGCLVFLCVLCLGHGVYIYMCVLILNNSLDVGQQSVQLGI